MGRRQSGTSRWKSRQYWHVGMLVKMADLSVCNASELSCLGVSLASWPLMGAFVWLQRFTRSRTIPQILCFITTLGTYWMYCSRYARVCVHCPGGASARHRVVVPHADIDRSSSDCLDSRVSKTIEFELPWVFLHASSFFFCSTF